MKQREFSKKDSLFFAVSGSFIILSFLIGLIFRFFYYPMTDAEIWGFIVGISITPLLINKKKRYSVFVLFLLVILIGIGILFILDIVGVNANLFKEFLSGVVYPWILLLFIVGTGYFWRQYRELE